MKIKNLVLTALITDFALCSFIIESAIPPITPIYGIKLGISNIFTLFTLYALGARQAAAVLFLRIFLGCIFTGQMMALLYSLAGGLLSFAVMLLLKRFFSLNQVWVLSVICAVVHNTGQIAVAVLITQTMAILCYYPVLIVAGIIAGAFTGICAQIVLKRFIIR